MAYATLAEFKAFVGITDTADDVALQTALDAASNQVDGFCDQIFTTAVQTRLYRAPQGLTPLRVYPIASTSGLAVTVDMDGDGTFETTWTLNTDYRLEPINAALESPPRPWTRIIPLGTKFWPVFPFYYRPGVSVNATHGWPTSPPQPVKLANLIQASRLFKRKDAPFGVAGSVQFGSELRLLNEIDRDAQNLLRPYRRNWWAA